MPKMGGDGAFLGPKLLNFSLSLFIRFFVKLYLVAGIKKLVKGSIVNF